MAHPVLMQRKYVKVIMEIAKIKNISNDEAMDMFYNSNIYLDMKGKIADTHCRSDKYLADDVINEYIGKTN